MQKKFLTSFRQNKHKSVTCGCGNFHIVVPFMFSIMCGWAILTLLGFVVVVVVFPAKNVSVFHTKRIIAYNVYSCHRNSYQSPGSE